MLSTGITVIDFKKEVAARLAKKGTASDYTIYNRKTDSSVFCFYEPTLYPEKIVSLLHCLNSSDLVLIVFDGISKELGEVVVASHCLEKNGIVCFRDGSREDFLQLARGTAVEKFVECAYDDAEILSAIEKLAPKKDASVPLRITVDSSFNVKSVGLVVLGIGKSGTVNVHDELTAFPSGKKITVRSIQVQDKDVQSSTAGDRVGLCLKNVELNDVQRGTELVKDNANVAEATELAVEAEITKFQKTPLLNGASIFVSAGMQYAVASIQGDAKPGEKTKIKLSLQKPFAFEKNTSALLIDAGRTLRILGKITFI
ncbi:hypothetical protein HY992_05155 [Candidatus Micrarchaeota archaeon]|nr:hypothetical protein [Candidatus Micrarchaeota archaeon]